MGMVIGHLNVKKNIKLDVNALNVTISPSTKKNPPKIVDIFTLPLYTVRLLIRNAMKHLPNPCNFVEQNPVLPSTLFIGYSIYISDTCGGKM